MDYVYMNNIYLAFAHALALIAVGYDLDNDVYGATVVVISLVKAIADIGELDLTAHPFIERNETRTHTKVDKLFCYEN